MGYQKLMARPEMWVNKSAFGASKCLPQMTFFCARAWMLSSSNAFFAVTVATFALGSQYHVAIIISGSQRNIKWAGSNTRQTLRPCKKWGSLRLSRAQRNPASTRTRSHHLHQKVFQCSRQQSFRFCLCATHNLRDKHAKMPAVKAHMYTCIHAHKHTCIHAHM